MTGEGIELIWTSKSDSTETEYVLYRRVLPHESLSEYATVPRSGNSTSFTDADVEPGLEYLYRVTGVNSAGEGPKSDPVRLVVPGERLEAPADLAAVYTEQGMEVTWSVPTNAGITDYQVYRGKFLNDGEALDGAVSKYVKTPADGDPMTYLDTNVDQGAKYRYRVAAVNATGEGFKTTWLDVQATISETLVVPGERLEAPADLAAVYTEQGMEVTWSAPTNAEITDYQVYRGKFLNDGRTHDGAASKYVMIPAGGDPMTYLDTNVEEGAKYRYRVAAVNATGEGFKTTWLDVQATISEADINTQATGQPTISGTAQVGETLTADDSGIADEDGLTNVVFSYQWLRNDGTADTHIAEAIGVAYTLVSEDEGKTIKVEVSFTDEAGNEEMRTSEPTNPVAAAVVAAALPTKPLNLTVTRGSQIEELDASWQTPASDITGYRVQWKEAADSWDTPEDVSEETVTGTTHTIHGLTEGVEYAVRVMATNQVGEGPASAEKTAVLRDTRAPEVVTFRVDGATLRVVYDEALDEGSAPPADAFDVRVACSCDDMTWLDEEAKRAVNLVSVDGGTVMLTLASPATADDYVVVSYNPPSDEASPRVQDVAGNAAAAIKSTQIINDTEEVSEDEAPAQNTSATGLPTISGTIRVGQTLTADTTGIADEDGLTNAVFSYQWMADDTDIQDATGSSYTLVSDDEGKAITVTVTFTDAEGHQESRTSEPTGAVEAAPNTSATGVPTISGTIRVGETLTADVTGIADEDGLDNVVFSYQWMADDTNIQDATGSSYTLTEDDEGKAITVTVSFTDAEGNPETLTSDPTGEVVAAPAQNIQATGVPTISGTIQVGETLTADVTGIVDADGLTSPAFTYQWVRNDGGADANIQGATGATYTLVSDDEGKAITVRVSFTDDANNEESLTSEPTGPVVPDPGPLTVFKVVDTSSNPDTVLGTLEDGGALTLEDPASGSYGIRVDTDSNDDIDKVELDLTGAKTRNKEEGVVPYSLYGDEGEGNLTGENLPAGAYELKATAYDDDGDVLGTLKVSFTVTAGQPAQQPTVVPNTSATGVPTISGTLRVGETLTADVTGIADEDGLDNVTFSYQWMADDTNIQDATGSSYTLTEDDEGKAITVRVSFTDDANNEESLTSEPTGPVTPDPGPLTVFKVVDTSSNPDTVLGTLEDGGALTLEDPASGSYGIRVDTDSGHDDHGDIDKVELDLTGAKTRNKEEGVFPYSLYGDEGEGNLTGENLPAGAYELKATAYDDDGDVLGTLKVSFTVTAGQPAQQPTVVPNTSATGVPTISGTLRVGETLTADVTGIADEDGLDNVVFSYQWMADDTNIQDATGSSYTLTEDDEGKAITVTVSFTDAEGNPETLTSDPTGEVAAAPAQNIQATGVPTISGTLQVGETLTADTTGIADVDGLTTVSYSYQWMADDTNIQGATDATYTLAEDDEGKAIKVLVSFADDAGNMESRPSAPTDAVAAPPAQNSSATGQPTISGTVRVGETLTADVTGIADEDGLTNAVFSYQWMADDTNIQDATGSNYTLVSDDEGKTIMVTVSFTDAEGNPETLDSDATGEVEAKPNTQATGAPTISGTAQVGQTLTADTSGIDDEDGLNQVVFSYQWIRNDGNADEDIAGATGSSYTLTGDDEGKTVKVTVSFTDDAEGNPETLTSDPTAEVESQAGPLTGFTVVDAADTDQAVLWKHQTDGSKPEEGDTWKEWTDGGTLALGDPESGRYGIRVDTESGEGIHRVALELTLESTGEKKVDRTDDAAPYSLYGDEGEEALHGESLPVGSYTLKATAYTEDGEILGSLEISFTVALAKPGRPQTLKGKASAQRIELAWKAPSGSVVTHYVIYRAELQNGQLNGRPMTKYATIDAAGKAMTYTDDNVEEGVEYRYRMAAVNSAGEGKKSNWLDI